MVIPGINLWTNFHENLRNYSL